MQTYLGVGLHFLRRLFRLRTSHFACDVRVNLVRHLIRQLQLIYLARVQIIKVVRSAATEIDLRQQPDTRLR